MTRGKQLVFLDIDGVLNSDAFFARCPDAHIDRDLDREAVARLEWLCSEGEAAIVISSTWRLDMSLDELRDVLAGHGLRAPVIGVTPTLLTERGEEIRAWLRDNPGWRSYVILDDRADMGRLGRRLVQTRMHDGLLDEHVVLALRLLRRRVWLPW